MIESLQRSSWLVSTFTWQLVQETSSSKTSEQNEVWLQSPGNDLPVKNRHNKRSSSGKSSCLLSSSWHVLIFVVPFFLLLIRFSAIFITPILSCTLCSHVFISRGTKTQSSIPEQTGIISPHHTAKENEQKAVISVSPLFIAVILRAARRFRYGSNLRHESPFREVARGGNGLGGIHICRTHRPLAR